MSDGQVNSADGPPELCGQTFKVAARFSPTLSFWAYGHTETSLGTNQQAEEGRIEESC